MSEKAPNSQEVVKKSSELLISFHGEEILANDANRDKVMEILCDNLKPGDPVLIETNPIVTKAGGPKEVVKMLFLSDGEFRQSGEFCARKGNRGCAMALVNENGYSLTRRASSRVISSNALSQNAIKSIHIGETALLPNFEAICGLRFAEDAIYINPSDYRVPAQQKATDRTIEFLNNILAEALKNQPVIFPNGRTNRVKRNGVGARKIEDARKGKAGYTVASGHIIDPSDYLVYENHRFGRDLGFLKFDSVGNGFFLPRRSMREIAEKAFNPSHIKQLYAEN